MQFQKTYKIKAVSQAPSVPLSWLKKKTNQHNKKTATRHQKNITNITLRREASVKSKVGTLSQWKHGSQAGQKDLELSRTGLQHQVRLEPK